VLAFGRSSKQEPNEIVTAEQTGDLKCWGANTISERQSKWKKQYGTSFLVRGTEDDEEGHVALNVDK